MSRSVPSRDLEQQNWADDFNRVRHVSVTRHDDSQRIELCCRLSVRPGLLQCSDAAGRRVQGQSDWNGRRTVRGAPQVTPAANWVLATESTLPRVCTSRSDRTNMHTPTLRTRLSLPLYSMASASCFFHAYLLAWRLIPAHLGSFRLIMAHPGLESHFGSVRRCPDAQWERNSGCHGGNDTRAQCHHSLTGE